MNSTILRISRYVLKSAAEEDREEVQLTHRGVRHDRELIVSFDDPGKNPDNAQSMCTQRDARKRKLALIQVKETPDAFELHPPDFSTLRVPFQFSGQDVRQVSVHLQIASGIDQGEQASQWVTEYLGHSNGHPLRLLRKDPAQRRKISQIFSTDDFAHTAFADGYPLLVISEESLIALQAEIRQHGQEVTLESLRKRFRANLCLQGLDAPFLEDRIKTLHVGDGIELEFIKPCDRCPIPSVNQDTGEVDTEGKAVLSALSRFRRGHALGFGAAFPGLTDDVLNRTFFGMNAIVRRLGSGMLRRGEESRVVRMRSYAER